MTSRDASNKLAAMVEQCTADLSAVAAVRDAGDELAHEADLTDHLADLEP